MLPFKQDRLSLGEHPFTMSFTGVSPETRKDFVHSRSETLMVLGFIKVGTNLDCI